MDPNLFHLDWDRTAEVLAAIVLLSLVLERALAPLFESAWYIRRFEAAKVKEPIAVALASVVCILWQFDAISMIVLADRTNWFGCIVTGAVIAGGSKGSVQLFREWLKIKSTARKEYETKRALETGTATRLTEHDVATHKALAEAAPTKGKHAPAAAGGEA